MTIENELLGKTLVEAIDIVDFSEYSFRIVREDNNYYGITDDFNTERLNFELDNDLITKVSIG